MTTYQDYKEMQDKINAVADTIKAKASNPFDKKYDGLYNDACVDIANAGSDNDYGMLIAVAVNRFGSNCEEVGLKAQDFGFNY